MSSGQNTSSAEEKALTLLGQGIEPSIVASTVGLTESRISQLISDPEFSAKIAEARYKNLADHTARDKKYDSMEDQLLDMLQDCTPYMIGKPWMILKAIATINNANRRGAGSSNPLEKPSEIVMLSIPISIKQKYVLNVNQQVVQVGDKELVTAQSSSMNRLLENSVIQERVKELTHG